MVQINFKVDGVTELSRNLRITSTNLSKITLQFHEQAIKIIKARSDEIFANKGSDIANGPTWKPLSPTTEKARAKRIGYYKQSPNNPSVLRWTGRLQGSAVTTFDKTQGQLKYTAPYAIDHQRGGGNLPRRKIIDINPATATKIIKVMQELVNNSLGMFGKQR